MGIDKKTGLNNPGTSETRSVRISQDVVRVIYGERGKVNLLIEAAKAVGNEGDVANIPRFFQLKQYPYSLDTENGQEILFAGKVAEVCKQAKDYLEVVDSAHKTQDNSFNSGLDLGQSIKELIRYAGDEMAMSDEQVMGVFEAIFDNQKVLEDFKVTNCGVVINGIEAEIRAWLMLRKHYGAERVYFASKGQDGKEGFDIAIDDMALVQVKVGDEEKVSKVTSGSEDYYQHRLGKLVNSAKKNGVEPWLYKINISEVNRKKRGVK